MEVHAANYNYSQKAIFQQVAAAKTGDVILIQGPPGTGKTETITGIVSMLLQLRSSICRVHVCAPSNCAVDEILTRVKDRGLVGLTSEV
jgi:senataxin